MNLKTAIGLALLVSSCGGGGSSSPPPPPPNQQVGGLWYGQFKMADGTSWNGVAVVAEDGRFFSEASSATCGEIAVGRLVANQSALTGIGTALIAPLGTAACAFSDGSVAGDVKITGTVAQQATMDYSDIVTPFGSAALAAEQASLKFDPNYNESSSLTRISGVWTDIDGTVTSIDSNGVLFSQDAATGCIINGSVSIINPSYNVYAESVTYSSCAGSMMAFNGITARGLATVNDTAAVGHAVLIYGYSYVLNQSGIILVGKLTR